MGIHISTKQRLKNAILPILGILVIFMLLKMSPLGRDRFYQLAGGLAVFLYGMLQMTRGLELMAGENIRRYFEIVTGNRVTALLTGLGVTTIIQSSSACTVMIVGFVNAGMMTLTQAAAVIMGSNIGTTITGQLIAFKISKMALPIIATGALFLFLSKSRKKVMFGQVLIGFGLLFIGMQYMESVVAPLKKDPAVQQWLAMVSHNLPMGVLVGTIFTIILQSSSATVAVTMTMASAGLIDYETSVAFILGDNIGTTITAQLAALPAGRPAKRAAMVHTMFNVFGVLIAMIIFPWYLSMVTMVSGDADVLRKIANAHSLFNVANSLIFLILLTPLVKACELIIPFTPSEKERTQTFLDKTLLTVPSVALEAVGLECSRLAGMTRQAVEAALGLLRTQDEKLEKVIMEQEKLVDAIEHDIVRYALLIEEKELSKGDTQLINRFIAFSHNQERLADECENILEIVTEQKEHKVSFSEHAAAQIYELSEKVRFMVDGASRSFLHGEWELAEEVLAAETMVNEMVHRFREDHLTRLMAGDCNPVSGHFFLDIIDRLEKMGDRCRTIAYHARELHGE